jgi:hypothetical protein
MRNLRWDKSKLDRWSRLLTIIMAVMATAAGALVSLRKEYDIKDNPIPLILVSAAMVVAVITAMVKYLTEETPSQDVSQGEPNLHSVAKVRENDPFLPDLFLADIKYKHDAISIIRDIIKSDVAVELTEKLFTNALMVSRMREQSQAIVNRLTTEISALSRRANTALIIGTVTCVLGVILLGIFSLLSPIEYPSWKSVIVYYVPRLSVVLFLQVFAYFFLRLYRNGIYEIKYFQNEITNVQARVLALQTGLILNNDDIIKSACRSLIATERNFILKKGEKTIPIVQEEMGNLGDRMPFDLLERITNRVVEILKRNKGNDTENPAGRAG